MRHDALVPPPALRHRVHGALDEATYLNAGKVVADDLVAAWRRHDQSPAPVVLDFGCGPGRIATEFKRRVPASTIHATDIDDEAIAWARSNLGTVGIFERNGPAPPLDYPDRAFDLIYAVSVFTHLDEEAQLAWLGELRRVLREDGILIATTHGALARESCTPAELSALSTHGFVYRVDRRGRFRLDPLPDSYQTSFHTHEYIENTWQRFFRIVEYAEGGLAHHQDLIVLRPAHP